LQTLASFALGGSVGRFPSMRLIGLIPNKALHDLFEVMGILAGILLTNVVLFQYDRCGAQTHKCGDREGK
jgi:hypothetical protein